MQRWQFGTADDTLVFFSLQILPVTLILSLSYFAAKKDTRFVEAHGAILFVSQLVAIVLFEYSGLFEMDEFYHLSLFDVILVYWLFYVGLLTTQFKWHSILRIFILVPAFVTLMALSGVQEFKEAFSYAVFTLVVAAIGELIFYVQMKAQVKLFIASQVIEMQERQLLNMLDTVPDKVLVCSIERKDDLKAQPLYNNRQMKEFFGQSLVV